MKEDCYANPTSMADDLNLTLLAEFDLSETAGGVKGVSLFSSQLVENCERIVERLIRLREISPVDIVALSSFTERANLRPLVCSLALALRKVLQRVVLLDCDLRAPTLQAVAAVEGKEGFIDMVKYGCSFFTAAAETDAEGIYVIGAGSHPVTSEGELVGRELERVFHSLRPKAEITLAIIPPFLGRKQVNPILNCVDGVLLCVNSFSSGKSMIRRDFSALWKSDIPVLGLISEKPNQVEERQTLVLEARQQDSAAAVSGASGASGATPATGASGATGASSATSATNATEAHSSWRPISSTDEGTRVGGLRRGEAVGGEAKYRTESTLVEKSLFGRQKHWRQYVVGMCVVFGIIGVLALKQTRFSGTAATKMDEKTLRSILLPGSDGVTSGDDIQNSGPESSGARTGLYGSGKAEVESRYFIGTALRSNYGEAEQDSAKVSSIGLGVYIKSIDSGARGTGYMAIVGPFRTSGEARAGLSRLGPLGLSGEVRSVNEGVK